MERAAQRMQDHPEHRLDPLLAPRSIALVGASNRPNSAGNALLTMARADGYEGRVYPVNPKYESIDGLTCYPGIEALPETPDHAVLSVPNAGLEAAFDAAVAEGVRAVTIFASCHLDDDQPPGLAERLAAKARAAGVAICGGNCMGFYNVRDGLRAATFMSPPGLRKGGIVWIAQSGSAFSALTHNDRRFGFLLAVSSGMEMTTGLADYMDWALAQEATRVIGLFIETVRDPKGFERALAEAAWRNIPVVALKVGRTARSAAMALTHTGALAGDDAAYSALFRRHGVLQVDDLDEMAALLALLDTPKRIGPGALASLHDSGGEREMLVDLAERQGLPLAEVGPETKARIAANLDPGLVAENPLDAWGTDRDFVRRYTECLSAMLDDPNVALGIFSSDVRDGYWYSAGILDAVVAASEASSKPVAIVSNYTMTLDVPLAREAAERGVPVLKGIRPALRAIRRLFDQRDRAAGGPPPEAPAAAVERWRPRLSTGPLSEAEGLEMLADFGIAAPRTRLVDTVDQAARAAADLTAPFVLKTAEGHGHKSDVGGVRVGLKTAADLWTAYAEMASRLGPKAVVAEMAPSGVEIGLGARVDPVFGPVVMVSAGGTLIEVLDDRAVALAPFGEDEARALLSELRVARLLAGVRGAAPSDMAALARTVSAFSAMVAALGDALSEIDVNPVIASPSGAVAVDCLVIPARKG